MRNLEQHERLFPRMTQSRLSSSQHRLACVLDLRKEAESLVSRLRSCEDEFSWTVFEALGHLDWRRRDSAGCDLATPARQSLGWHAGTQGGSHGALGRCSRPGCAWLRRVVTGQEKIRMQIQSHIRLTDEAVGPEASLWHPLWPCQKFCRCSSFSRVSRELIHCHFGS